MTHPLEEAVRIAFPDAHDLTLIVVGGRCCCEFKAPSWRNASFVGRASDVTPDMIRVAAIARHSKGVLTDIEADTVTAAVCRVQATVVPLKVYILTGTLGGMSSGGEVVGVYATRKRAEVAAQGIHLPYVSEYVLEA